MLKSGSHAQKIFNLMTSKIVKELNIWVSGSEDVGKSSLLLNNSFKVVSKSDTTTCYSKRCKYMDNSYSIKAIESALDNFDLGALNSCQAIFICFNLAKRSSFDFIKEYVDKIKNITTPGILFCLVGTFADVASRPKISHQEIAYYCKMNDFEYSEVSCISGYNIKEPFLKLVKRYEERLCLENDRFLAKGSSVVNFESMIGLCFVIFSTWILKNWMSSRSFEL